MEGPSSKPDPTRLPAALHLQLRDGGGRLLRTWRDYANPGEAITVRGLAVGSYHLEVRDEVGRSGATELTVHSLAEPQRGAPAAATVQLR